MRLNIVRRLVLLIFKVLPFVLGDIGLYNRIFISRFMFFFLLRSGCVVDVKIAKKIAVLLYYWYCTSGLTSKSENVKKR